MEGEDEDDLGLDDPELEPDPEPDPEPEPAPAPNPAPEPAVSDSAIADSLQAVKDSWIELARVQGAPLADFDSIGLTGVGPDERVAFIAAAKVSHDARVEEYKKYGLVYNPEAAEAPDPEGDAVAAAWGQPIAGSGRTVNTDEKLAAKVEESVQKGDAQGVLKTLIGEGGLGKFVLKKH